MEPLRGRLEDARTDFEFVHSEQYRTPEEYQALKQQVYGNQKVSDGRGSLGSSALLATDLKPDKWQPSASAMAELAMWKRIPVPGEDDESAGDAEVSELGAHGGSEEAGGNQNRG
jgi:hypothetical protein